MRLLRTLRGKLSTWKFILVFSRFSHLAETRTQLFTDDSAIIQQRCENCKLKSFSSPSSINICENFQIIQRTFRWKSSRKARAFHESFSNQITRTFPNISTGFSPNQFFNFATKYQPSTSRNKLSFSLDKLEEKAFFLCRGEKREMKTLKQKCPCD